MSSTMPISTREVPYGWECPSLADIAQINPPIDRCPISESIQVNFVPMRAVEAEGGGLTNPEARPYGEVKKGYTAFLAGDVIMAKITPCMENGKTTVVPDLPGQVCFGSTEFHVIRAEQGIKSSWIARYLLQHDIRRAAQRQMTGGVGQMRVPASFLENLQIPLAPPNEQGRIADVLDELFSDLDEGVAALKRVQQNLKLYRASVLKAAVEGDLTAEWRAQHPDVEPASELLKRILVERRRRWEEDQLRKIKEKGQEPPTNWKSKYREPSPIEPGALPAILPNWVYASAESICASVRDGTHDTPTYVSEGIPLVTSKNLLQSGIDFENVKMISAQDHAEISKRSGVQQGDILFAMIGTVGNPVIVDTERAFSIKNVGLFKANIQFVNPRYLRVWFLCPEFKEWLEGKQKGTTQKFVPLGLLRALPVALPPLCEQEAIIEAVEGQVSIIDHLEVEIETKIKSAQALRQAILRHAFTGKLVPQDPNDEPASELLKRIAAKREARARDTTSTKWATKSGTRPYAARSRRYKEKRTKDN